MEVRKNCTWLKNHSVMCAPNFYMKSIIFWITLYRRRFNYDTGAAQHFQGLVT